MTKTTMLKVVNPILGLLLLNQLATGLLADKLPHEAFEFLHEGGGIALAVVAAIHVVLNWSWIKTQFLRRKSAE